MSNYEDTLSLEELRREVRTLWDREHALTSDLRDLPEIPSIETMRTLTGAGMATRSPDVHSIGCKMRRTHKNIPYKTEFECAVGLWSLMREGILAAKEVDANSPAR